MTSLVQQMIADLASAGYSQARIAQLCGVTQPTICRAAGGANMRYQAGKKLEELHRTVKRVQQ